MLDSHAEERSFGRSTQDENCVALTIIVYVPHSAIASRRDVRTVHENC